MDGRHKETEQLIVGWTEAFRKHPWRSLGLIALIAFLVIAGSFLASLGSRLASVEERVDQAILMKQEVSQTVNVVTEVKKEIANIKETIEQLYSQIQSDVFYPNDTDKRCSFSKADGSQLVALRLTACPVRGSIQGIWANKVLYPSSVRYVDNVIVTVFTGDAPPTNDTFSITYMRDVEKSHVFQKLEVKEGVLYLDGQGWDPTTLP